MLLSAITAYNTTVVCPARFLITLMAVCWALTVAAALARAPSVLQATLLVSLLASFTATVPLPVWPLPMLVPLTVFALALVPLRRAHTRLHWARVGTASGHIVAASLGVVLIASAALVVWVRLARPELSGIRAAIPPVHGATLCLLALSLSLLNSLMEELIWRGVIFSALDEALGPRAGALSLSLQALSFGCAHYYGFPSGLWGVAMATVYGLLLGAIRTGSRGLLAPVLVHTMADATIFAIVLKLTR